MAANTININDKLMPQVEMQMPMANPMTVNPSKSDLENEKSQEEILKEALENANKALRHYSNALVTLSNANDASIFDMICGCCCTDVVKYDYISSAKKQTKLGNEYMNKLKELLKDVKDIKPIKINDFLTFTDIFLDDIISDFLVQSKISNARTNCKKAIAELKTIIKELEDSLQQIKK